MATAPSTVSRAVRVARPLQLVARMGRAVHAVLIAGDDADAPGTATPGALEALDIVARDLAARFGPDRVALARLDRAPTRSGLSAALGAACAAVRPGDLLIAMYAGHGCPADRTHPTAGWALTRAEVFRATDLAIALGAVPARVDTVVISNCCYGEGVFCAEPGAPNRRRDQLHSASRAQTAVLRRAGNRPMVCISAASDTGQVSLAKLDDLAREITAAAAARQSYAELAASFAAKALVGREFHVDARPELRLAEIVLSTERARAVRRPQ